MMVEIKDMPSALLVIQQYANEKLRLEHENEALRTQVAHLRGLRHAATAQPSLTWYERAVVLVRGAR